MLLRSVTKHIKEQNWFAVFVDFLIVVVGVFIGIQVANWNASQQSLKKEEVYLERLDKEMTVIIERLEDASNRFRNSVDSLQILLDARKEYSQNPDSYKADKEQLKTAFTYISSGRVPASSPAVFKEMISNGELALIRNHELRQALYEFDEYSLTAVHAWDSLRDQLNTVAPPTIGILTYKTGKPKGDTDELYQYLVPDEFNLQRLLNQSGLSGTLSSMMKSQANQLGVVNFQLKLARDIELQFKMNRTH